MRLQDRLPDTVAAHGRTYRVDLDFRRVLDLLGMLARDDLTPEARVWLALRCVMRRPPRRTQDQTACLDALRAMLFDRDKKPTGEKLTDFDQDADLIRAAFLQEYGVNLWRDRLHWLEFTALLSGLPEGSKYTEILGIRARPMPPPTKYNAELRRWLRQAKAECAVRMTDKEREESYRRGLRAMAESLLGLAEKGGE